MFKCMIQHGTCMKFQLFNIIGAKYAKDRAAVDKAEF